MRCLSKFSIQWTRKDNIFNSRRASAMPLCVILSKAYNIPSIISKKLAYADNLAILHTSGEWKELERTLSQDMTTLSECLQTWRLKLSHTKTVTAAFHLHNQEAKRELKVCNIGKTLPFCPVPTYLGVKLDRSLTYRPYLEALRKKLCDCVSLLRRLVGTSWGASS